MGSMRAAGLTREALPATVRLCSASLVRGAARVDGSVLQLPVGSAERAVEKTLLLYLTEADRSGWVVVDDATGQVMAFAGATAIVLTPDDWRYTWMPPRSVLVVATACHAASDEAAAECYPPLLQEIRRLAEREGMSRVTVHTRPGGTVAAETWRDLGLRPSARMAVRRVATWQPVGSVRADVTVRRDKLSDVEPLADLAMEEHLYHAYHTGAGTSADQSREASRRLAIESIRLPVEQGCQLVAEHAPADGPPRIVGSIVGLIVEWNDDQVQRYVLPARYGYIGLTAVTQHTRGQDVGAALTDAVMAWFATRRIDSVFLHYVADNPLSSRFWPRMGFEPYHEIIAHTGTGATCAGAN